MAVINTDVGLDVRLAMLIMIQSDQVSQDILESWANVFNRETERMTEKVFVGVDIQHRTLWMNPDKMTISLTKQGQDIPGSVIIGEMQLENHNRLSYSLPFIRFKFQGRIFAHAFHDEALSPESARFMISCILDYLDQPKFD